MSKTVAVTHGQRNFWAFDLSLGIWLRGMLDVVHERGLDAPGQVFEVDTHEWELSAFLGANQGFTMPVDWPSAKVAMFVECAGTVHERLRARDIVTGEEVTAMRVMGDKKISRATAPFYAENGIATKHVVELGEAIVALLSGTLPKPPKGTWWAFGFAGNETTIEMVESAEFRG